MWLRPEWLCRLHLMLTVLRFCLCHCAATVVNDLDDSSSSSSTGGQQAGGGSEWWSWAGSQPAAVAAVVGAAAVLTVVGLKLTGH